MSSFDCCSYSVTVGVDILDVSKVYEMGNGELKVRQVDGSTMRFLL